MSDDELNARAANRGLGKRERELYVLTDRHPNATATELADLMDAPIADIYRWKAELREAGLLWGH